MCVYVCESPVTAAHHIHTSHKYGLTPPSGVFQLRERFHNVTCQMEQASKWKEAITGEPYDLDFLEDMKTQMDLRQELWKYIEVSIHSIREWKTILFRKVGCS